MISKEEARQMEQERLQHEQRHTPQTLRDDPPQGAHSVSEQIAQERAAYGPADLQRVYEALAQARLDLDRAYRAGRGHAYEAARVRDLEAQKIEAASKAAYDQIAGAEALRDRARETRPLWRFDVGHRVRVSTPPDRPLLAREGEVGVVTEVSRSLGNPDRYDYRVQFPTDSSNVRLYLEGELEPAAPAGFDQTVAADEPMPRPSEIIDYVPDEEFASFEQIEDEEAEPVFRMGDVLAALEEEPDGLPPPGDVEAALAWIEACRDSHVGWTAQEVIEHTEEQGEDPWAVAQFHEDTVAGYERVLETLRDALEDRCVCVDDDEFDEDDFVEVARPAAENIRAALASRSLSQQTKDALARLTFGNAMLPTLGDVVEEVRALNERLSLVERQAFGEADERPLKARVRSLEEFHGNVLDGLGHLNDELGI